jgi:hypothetical protein
VREGDFVGGEIPDPGYRKRRFGDEAYMKRGQLQHSNSDLDGYPSSSVVGSNNQLFP